MPSRIEILFFDLMQESKLTKIIEIVGKAAYIEIAGKAT